MESSKRTQHRRQLLKVVGTNAESAESCSKTNHLRGQSRELIGCYVQGHQIAQSADLWWQFAEFIMVHIKKS